MTSKEKKDIVVKEVIIEGLKAAGYRGSGLTYYIEKEDFHLAINIQSSRFNSVITGYNFRLNINTITKDISIKELKYQCSNFSGIQEYLLLPDCGMLHPYHDILGYRIDGYKDYKPQDMDIENIKMRIRDDLQQEILPKLACVNTFSDWEGKKEEWEKQFDTPRVSLIRYYSSAQMSAVVQEFSLRLQMIQKSMGITNDEIRENEDLYQQVRALSYWASENKWRFIIKSLLEE